LAIYVARKKTKAALSPPLSSSLSPSPKSTPAAALVQQDLLNQAGVGERKTCCGESREILITIFIIIIIMAQRKKRESTLLTFFLSFPETKLIPLIIIITSASNHPNHHHPSQQCSFEEGGRGQI
jgi:hypothetical protein